MFKVLGRIFIIIIFLVGIGLLGSMLPSKHKVKTYTPDYKDEWGKEKVNESI